MVSYIGDDDDIIATYQDLAKEYSISQPEFWQSTETDMMFIVWGLVAILMIVLNMIEVDTQAKGSSCTSFSGRKCCCDCSKSCSG